MDQGFFVTAWQLSIAVIAFIITVVGATFTITRFIYKADGKLKLLEQRLDQYRDELSKYREEVLRLTWLISGGRVRSF